jgi:hypothetical protein
LQYTKPSELFKMNALKLFATLIKGEMLHFKGSNMLTSVYSTYTTHLPPSPLQDGQAARFSLGPLYCSGAVRPAQEADSCESLWSAGGGLARSGYHMVRRREEGGPRVVYCDLSRLPGEPGFERSFGSPGNLRDFVAFDAQLTQSIEDNYRYIGSIAVKVQFFPLENYDNRVRRSIKLSTNT